MERVTEIAPAKVNLGLKILGPRPDGYHNIISVVQTVDLCDRLIIERRIGDEFSVDCTDPDVPTGLDNLVVKAAQALRQRCGIEGGAHIHLEKRIPSGGGLGGGSSDAAATLRGLNRLWGEPVDEQVLAEVALTIGSDVPFLLRLGTALMEGRGERLRYLTTKAQICFVLGLPKVRVATPWAFSNVKFGLTEESPYIRFLNSLPGSEPLDPDGLWGCLENDFLPLVTAEFHEIARTLQAIRDTHPLAASLSGTGSTLFGVFPNESAATEAASELSESGYRVVVCRTISELPGS